MNMTYIFNQLEANISVFKELLKVPADIITYRNHTDKWNILEILCHLYDEEREDFRARLKHVLTTPKDPLPSIDPQAWVLSRNYAAKNFKEVLEKFLFERRESVKWLKSLNNPPLDNYYDHPKLGPLSGKLFLSNWLAHDYLHFRQIIKLKFDFLKQTSGQNTSYAGSW